MTSPISEIKYDEVDTIPDNFKPFICNINVTENTIPSISPELSLNYDHPLLSLGFQQYLHANVNKMQIIKEFEGKKKVYTTMHLFNKNIDNYDSGINNVTTEYFKFSPKQTILGDGFYKLWEIMSMFDIVPLDASAFKSVHIAETDGSFAQSTNMFREMFSKKSHNNDEHFIIPFGNKIDSEFIKTNDKKITLSKIILNINDEKTETPKSSKQRIQIYDTETFNPKNIIKISSENKNKADLVTAYGALDWKYNILLEQDINKLLIFEITCALNILDNGGCFVCRLYETFTSTTCKLIYMLAACFENVHIMKPLTSHMSTSERFIVCQKYKPKPKLIEQMEKLLKTIYENPTQNIVNIFPDLILRDDFHLTMMCINTELANSQILSINKIVAFIKAQNYFGDMYTEGQKAQIIASAYWVNLYYPNKGDYSKMKKLLDIVKNNVLHKTLLNIDHMKKFV